MLHGSRLVTPPAFPHPPPPVRLSPPALPPARMIRRQIVFRALIWIFHRLVLRTGVSADAGRTVAVHRDRHALVPVTGRIGGVGKGRSSGSGRSARYARALPSIVRIARRRQSVPNTRNAFSQVEGEAWTAGNPPPPACAPSWILRGAVAFLRYSRSVQSPRRPVPRALRTSSRRANPHRELAVQHGPVPEPTASPGKPRV